MSATRRGFLAACTGLLPVLARRPVLIDGKPLEEAVVKDGAIIIEQPQPACFAPYPHNAAALNPGQTTDVVVCGRAFEMLVTDVRFEQWPGAAYPIQDAAGVLRGHYLDSFGDVRIAIAGVAVRPLYLRDG